MTAPRQVTMGGHSPGRSAPRGRIRKPFLAIRLNKNSGWRDSCTRLSVAQRP